MANFDVVSSSRWNMVGGINTFIFWMNIKKSEEDAFLLDGRNPTGSFGGYLYIDPNNLLRTSYNITEVKVNDIVIDHTVDTIPVNQHLKLEVSFNASSTDHINRFFSHREANNRCYLKGVVYAVQWICGGDGNKSSLWRLSPLFLEEGSSAPLSIKSLTSHPALVITPVTPDTSPWKEDRYLVNQEISTALYGWHDGWDWWSITDGMAYHASSSEQRKLWQAFLKSPLVGTKILFDYKFETGQPVVYLQMEGGSGIEESLVQLPTDSTEVVTVEYEVTSENAFAIAFSGNSEASSFSISNIRFVEP